MDDASKPDGAPASDTASLSKGLATTAGAVQVAQSAAQVAGVSSSGLATAGQVVGLAQSAASFDGSVSAVLGSVESADGLASALGAASPAVQTAAHATEAAESAWAVSARARAASLDTASPTETGATAPPINVGGPGVTAPEVNQLIAQPVLTAQDATADYDDAHRLFRLYSSLPDEKRLFLHTLDGHEAFNEIPEFRLELLSRNADIELKDLTGKPLVVGIRQTDGSERLLSGFVSAFELLRTTRQGWSVYAATLVPWTHILTLNQDCRCEQEKTVRQVIEDVLAPYGPAAKFEFRLLNQYEPQSLIVQYQQSDWAFIAYLIEREGWTTFHEYAMDGQTLVITDDTVDRSRCPPLPVYDAIEFNGDDGVLPYNRVSGLHAVRQVQPTVFSLDTFDHKAPRGHRSVSMPTIAQQGDVPDVEVFDGTPGYAYRNRAEGERYARIRMEELEARTKRFEGRSDCPDLRPGGTTLLRSHPQFTQGEEDRLLILRVAHRGRNNFLGDSGDGPTLYTNSFTAMRQKVPHRPARVHPRASIHGHQSAIVTGPPGQEIWTNQHGCIKVRFHWDRRARFDDSSSPWLRVAQTWAGAGWGSMSIPRVGQEVLVSFLEGDPARPEVLGSVYNGDQRPPHALPEAGHMMGFRSNSTPHGGGYSEMAIHDTKGSELVKLRSQKDMTVHALNNQSTVIGNNQSTLVKQQIHIESIEADISVAAKTKVAVSCGDKASIVMTEDGKVAITGTEITINGQHIVVTGSDSVDLNCGQAAPNYAGPDTPADPNMA